MNGRPFRIHHGAEVDSRRRERRFVIQGMWCELMDTERNLLVAMRALALGLIDDERFRVVCRGWSEDRAHSVEQRLVESGGIDEAARQRLMADVGQRLSLAGDDPVRAYQEELAQDSRVAALVCELDDDPVVAATLDEQPRDGHVLIATLGEEESDAAGPNLPANPLRYTLHRVWGKGGLGQVWMAQDRTLNRRVALKELKPGRVKRIDSPATRGILRRFLREAQITGQLQHPNIVPVYDVERRDSGLPFYTMKLVEGQTFAKAIAEYHERRQSGQDDSVEFARLLQAFVGVCQAVAYANANGVVHRDLKPQNVVLGGFGEVIVLDWGEAKLVRPTNSVGGVAVTDQEADTATQPDSVRLVEVTAEAADLEKTYGLVGTPAYLSPEQAEQRIDDIDQTTDVYGLGTILFHVVAGISPHGSRPGEKAESNLRKLIDRIIAEPTPRLRQFRPSTSAALDAVCAKAMAKIQTERYASATTLAKDVQRFLADEPVSVLSEPFSVRVARWMKRHRTLVATTAAALIVAIIGVSVLAAMSSRHAKVVETANDKLGTANRNLESANQKERAASDRATQKAHEAEVAAARATTEAARAEVAKQDAEEKRERAERVLYASRIKLAQQEWELGNTLAAHHLLDDCRWDLRGWEHDYLWSLLIGNHQTLHGHTSQLVGSGFSRDGKWLFSASHDGTVKVWEMETGAEIRHRHKRVIGSEGSLIGGGYVGVSRVAFSPVFDRVVSASRKTLKVWKMETGEEIHTLDHSQFVTSLCFSADGKQILSSGEQTLKVWDAETGRNVLALKAPTGALNAACFSRDGKWIASGSRDSSDPFQKPGEIRIWNATTGEEVHVLRGHAGAVASVAFRPDGKLIVSGGSDMTIRLWDVETGQVLRNLHGHKRAVASVAFSPDGKRIASGGRDKTIKVWDAESGQLLRERGYLEHVLSVDFSPDGTRIAATCFDDTLNLWDVEDSRPLILRGHTGAVDSLDFSPDGKHLVTGGETTPRIWDVETGREIRTLRGHPGHVRSVCYSPDGKLIASGGFDRSLRVWDAQTGEPIHALSGQTGEVTSVAFDPHGKRLVSGIGSWSKSEQIPGEIKIWNIETGQELRTLRGHASSVYDVSFSSDGKRLLSASWDRTIKIWDAETGDEIRTLAGHTGGVICARFDSDGRRIVSASESAERHGTGMPGEIKLWDAETGEELRTLRGHTDKVFRVLFSPDGGRIVSAAADDTLKLWDARLGHEILTLRGHTAEVQSIGFRPDGKRLASGSSDKTVRIWGAETEQTVRTLRGHELSVLAVSFSPDGKRLVSGSGKVINSNRPGELKVWNAETGQEIRSLHGHKDGVFSVNFHSEGKLFSTASWDKMLQVWDLESGQLIHTRHGRAISPDGSLVVDGGRFGEEPPRVYEIETGREICTLRGHTGTVECLAFSPDGKSLVTGSADQTLKLWDAKSGETIHTLHGHLLEVLTARFSRDGKYVVSGSGRQINSDGQPGEIKIWETKTGREVRSLRGHTGNVLCVDFSPDGKRLASGGGLRDRTVKVWNVETGDELATLRGHTDNIVSVCFSPDGTHLVSGSWDRTVKVWRLDQLLGKQPTAR